MTAIVRSPLSGDLRRFLQFKRRLGYPYARAEFTLAEFDRFLQRYVAHRRTWQLDQAMLEWLASKPQRKAVSVSVDAAVLRQLCRYLRRCDVRSFREPLWPKLPTESTFVPYILSKQEIHRLLDQAGRLGRPQFRAAVYRTLILVLYCTGLRFGEALRLRLRDVDTRAAVLFVDVFKGRARWVPVHRSLARELDTYLAARQAYAPARSDDRLFVSLNRQRLPKNTAWHTLRKLFQQAGLKPRHGRVGPRPYDLRHAFAVHRLTRWYRQGIDLHAHLPWLSAYMGHLDILGTETYLTATPELLGLAGRRFRRHYAHAHTESRTP
jgi:integrase/recombinase XerD